MTGSAKINPSKPAGTLSNSTLGVCIASSSTAAFKYSKCNGCISIPLIDMFIVSYVSKSESKYSCKPCSKKFIW